MVSGKWHVERPAPVTKGEIEKGNRDGNRKREDRQEEEEEEDATS